MPEKKIKKMFYISPETETKLRFAAYIKRSTQSDICERALSSYLAETKKNN
jgi:hypothetical protein